MLASSTLTTVNFLHTAIWAIIATCIVAIPFLGWTEMYVYALLLTGIVVLEIAFFEGEEPPYRLSVVLIETS